MTLTVRLVRLLVWLGATLVMLSVSVGVAAPLVTTCTSAVSSGMWNSAATWDCGHVPVADDIVIITVDDTITVDVDTAALGSLTVDGFLIIGKDATVRTVTVSGNLTIGSGGRVEPGSTSHLSSESHLIVLGGNIVNDGVLDGLASSKRLIDVTFDNTSADQTVSGAGTTAIDTMIMDKSDASNRVIASMNVTIGTGADDFDPVTGTWEQNAGLLTPSNSNVDVKTNGGLAITGNGSMTLATASIVVAGDLTVNTTGSVNVGNGNNRIEVKPGGVALLTAGMVNIGGRLLLTSGSTTLDGATVNIEPQGTVSLSGSSLPFQADGAADLTMSNGILTIVNPHAENANEIEFFGGSGTKQFSGGVIRLGDGISVSPAGDDGFQLDLGGYTLPNLTIERQQGSNNRFVILNGTTTVAGTVVNKGALLQTETVGASESIYFGRITDAVGTTDKYKGVEIATGTDLGSTTIKLYGNQNTSGSTGTPVNRWFQIHPANAGTADLTFYFLCTELQGSQAPDNLKVWQFHNSTWTDLGRDASSACDGDGYGSVTVNNIDLNATEDTFVLKIFNPLAVNLETFTATPDLDAGQVRVAWETVNEVDNLGFYLYRAVDGVDAWTQITPKLIPSQSPGSPWGFVYEWTDRDVVFGERYVYRLASMDMAGLAEVVDTTEAQFGVWQRVWMPRVGR